MSKITLILGGIRSGKSHFAEIKTLKWSKKPYYIATAIPFDKEMTDRIAIHKERRKENFYTIEEPYDLNSALSKLTDETVLIDCFTVNLSNRLLHNEQDNLEAHINNLDTYISNMVEIIQKNNLRVFAVSNEVGTSPVSPNKLGRFFQDLQGRMNCLFSQKADEVYMIEAGIPRIIKKSNSKPFKLSAPSYVIPADYISNVSYLQDKVDDIQLLLFDATSDDPLFNDETFFTLKYLMNGGDFSYSAHMPSKPYIIENYELKKSETLKIIKKLTELNIKNYTFHYDLHISKDNNEYEKIKSKTDKLYINFFKELKKQFPDIDFNLENTTTSLSELDFVVNKSNINYCIDIGHYLLNGFEMSDIHERIKKTTVIHLHGLKKTESGIKDHETITGSIELFKILENFTGIVTIENYHKKSLEKSIEILNDYF